MNEILDGLFHWSARHPKIDHEVSSYFLRDGGVLIDPLLPPDGLTWFDGVEPPAAVLMTNRHHDRDAARFVEAFGCTVHCPAAGLHELEGRLEARGYGDGDELPGGVLAVEIGAICPDEFALLVPSHRAVAIADGVVRFGDGPLSFVPDEYLGDDPEGVKAGLRAALPRLFDHDFEHLLLAHGAPWVGGGREALREFLAAA